jgi:hypothetical protein
MSTISLQASSSEHESASRAALATVRFSVSFSESDSMLLEFAGSTNRACNKRVPQVLEYRVHVGGEIRPRP